MPVGKRKRWLAILDRPQDKGVGQAVAFEIDVGIYSRDGRLCERLILPSEVRPNAFSSIYWDRKSSCIGRYLDMFAVHCSANEFYDHRLIVPCPHQPSP